MNYLGENELSAVRNCLWYHLPSNIPPQYFHKIKTDSKQRSKEYILLHTVLVVKETRTEGGQNVYQRAHVSFQSNSSCNIYTVN